jgi:hypothetical protein
MKATKALYEMGCGDMAFMVFSFFLKGVCELCVDLVVFVLKEHSWS